MMVVFLLSCSLLATIIEGCVFCSEAVIVEVLIGAGDGAPMEEKYPGQVAAFGNQVPDGQFLNLMLPPHNDSHLCNFPRKDNDHQEWLMSMNDTNFNETTTATAIEEEESSSLIARDNMNVTLFVSYGECPPSQKAQIALDLRWRHNYTRYGTITHLLIYNNNYEDMDELHTLTSSLPDMEDIVVIFVSTRTGRDIMELVREEEKDHERLAKAEFMADGNEFWYFPVSFQELPESSYTDGSGSGFHDIDPYSDNFSDPYYYDYPKDSSSTTSSGTIPEADDFYWFRLIVFSLLVVSPCFRAGYLWYAGGARIRFRYNDQGRIVGLQYTPPMPYWFAPQQAENPSHPATQMTEEQVMALPEIVYSGAAASSVFNDETVTTPLSTSPKNDDVDTSATDTTADPEQLQDTTTASPLEAGSVTVTESLSDDDVNVNPQQQPTGEMYSTCPICIDDFEQGERLRMLPRCRHVFHTDCILPWLTERQGCCPFCKTEVIEPPPSSDDDNNNEQDMNLSAGAPAEQARPIPVASSASPAADDEETGAATSAQPPV